MLKNQALVERVEPTDLSTPCPRYFLRVPVMLGPPTLAGIILAQSYMILGWCYRAGAAAGDR